MAGYLTEDGSGYYELEDGSGFLELEDGPGSIDAPFIAATTTVYTASVARRATRYSYSFFNLQITSTQGVLVRVTGASSTTFTLTQTTTGSPGVATGASYELFTLDIRTQSIPESFTRFDLDIESEGFRWGAQPDYVGHGALAVGTFSASVPYPSGLALNDTLVVICESDGDYAVGAAFNRFRTIGTAILAGQTRLTVMMKAHWYSSESSVTISGGGGHLIARCFALRGARSKPNYFGPGSSGTASGTNQTLTFEGTIASVEECLIFLAMVHGLDVSTSNVWSGYQNLDLIAKTERFEDSNTTGSGGGLALLTAYVKQAFPDPFDSTTVVNALTNPTYAGAHTSIEPILFPPNDNFANATLIEADIDEEDPGALRYDGWTYNATKEVGEVVSIPSPVGSNFHNTSWWKFVAERRQIVSVRLHRDEPVNYNYYEAVIAPRKGATVSTVSQYAVATNSRETSFGADDGKGVNFGALYAEDFSSHIPLRIQVTPEEPLYLQVGRQDFDSIADCLYHLDVRINQPPDNDDFDDALLIEDGVNGSDVFNLDDATGQPGFLPDAASYNVQSIGDVWYKVQPTVDRQFGVRIARDLLPPNVNNLHIHGEIYQGNSLGGLTFLYNFKGGDENEESFHTAVDMVAGQTYYIVVMWDRAETEDAVSDYPVGGVLDWRFFTQPSNDDFADAEDLGTNDSGSTSAANLQGATTEVDEPFLSGYANQFLGDTIWWEFTPASGGWYEFSFPSGPGDISLYLVAYRGTVLADLKLANYDFIGFGKETGILALRAGETYKLQLSLYAGFGSQYAPDYETMSWELIEPIVSPADDFANRVVLTGASGNEPFSLRGATSEEDEWTAYYYDIPPDTTVWYEWTCPADGYYFFEMDAFNPDDLEIDFWQTALAIYDGDPFAGDPANKVCGNQGGEPNANTKVAFDAVNGQTYYIQLEFYHNLDDEDGYDPFEGELNWGAHVKATNELFADAIDLLTDSGSIAADTYGLSIDLEPGILVEGFTLEEIAGKVNGFSEAELQTFPVGRTTWYKFTPTLSGRWVWLFNEFDNGANVLVNFFKGTDPSNLERVPKPTDFSGYSGGYYQDYDDGQFYAGFYNGYNPYLPVYTDLEAGETYYILVSGFIWDNIESATFYDLANWQREDMFQSSYTMDWALFPPDNDNYSTVRFFTNNIGNLNFYTNYNNADFPPGNFTSFGGAGGCRSGTLVGGSPEVGEPAHAGIAAARSVWYKLVTLPGGSYKIWVEGDGSMPSTDPRLAVYVATSSVSSLGAAVASDDNSGPGNYPEVTVTLTGGTVYMIAVDGDLGGFKIFWQLQPAGTPPANDSFANAEVIPSSTITAGTTVNATVECEELPYAQVPSFFGGGGPYPSVWYQWVAPYSGSVLLRVDPASGSSTWVDVYHSDMTTNVLSTAYSNGSTGSVINLPVGVIGGDTYYIRVSNSGGGSAFTVEVQVQSETPPDNNDSEDAEDAVPTGGTGTFPGTTDGSNTQTGEPDPQNGGVLSNLAGTTWHKYVAPADGFIAAWASRDAPKVDWYRIGVWEGTVASSSILVPPYQDQPIYYGDEAYEWAGFYEVKGGETYLIQVIRDVTKPFGAYDLHIDEYLETNEWVFPDDGFDSTTGDIEIDGNLIRCTGSQAISDSQSVLPQYGTIDLGDDTKKWFRELRVHFDVRIVGGQILYREMWYGGDDTNNFGLASDDHVNYTTRSLGFLRMRDIDGNTRISAYLEAQNDGTNNIAIRTYMTNPTGFAPVTRLPVSLGVGRNQHDTGWVSVEILFTSLNNNYGYDGGAIQYGGAGSILSRVTAWVDGKPFTGPYGYGEADIGPQIRYVDFGMFRHPSMVYSNDQRYVENNEAWTFEMRDMRVTNKCLLKPYDVELAGDRGITQYDGFSTGKRWSVNPPSTVLATTPNTSADPIETMPTKTWKSVHTSGSTRATLRYNSQSGKGRVYATSIYLETIVNSTAVLAVYGFANPVYVPTTYAPSRANQRHGLATLLLRSNGELRIRPFGWKEHCVAHLEVGKHYFIEVHTDFRWKHDVRCTVYINEIAMGTYSSAWTWTDVAAANTVYGPPPRWNNIDYINTSLDSSTDLVFGQSSTPSHNYYYTNTVAARDPGDSIGAVQTVIMPAATTAALGGHLFPVEPDDEFELLDSDDQNFLTLFNWASEITAAGPWLYTSTTSGHDRFYPFPYTPRFWTPHFVLNPTRPQKISGGDYTEFGLSVPIDSDEIVQGFVVRAPTGRTIQLLKGGSPVGSTRTDSGDGVYGGEADLWGTSWTPQEVNALDFGVTVSGGTLGPFELSVQVFFEDEGGPDNIGRDVLGPADLANVWGDTVVAEAYFSGGPGEVHLGGFWEGGGEPGNARGGQFPLTGSPTQRWASIPGMWLWQARGGKTPSIDWTGGPFTGALTAQNFRAVRNPYVLPRFAYSEDNGATWTWMRDPAETDSVDHILPDAAAISPGDAVFLDNAAHLEVFSHLGGGWSSGFFEDRPTAARSYAFPHYQLRYGNDGTGQPDIIAVNVYLSCRAYDGYPKEASGSGNSALAMAELPDGNVRRIGYFSAGGTIDGPATSRQFMSRAPGSQEWTPDRVNDMVLRLGTNPTVDSDGFGIKGTQRGVVIYGAQYELLVPAEPDEPASGCFNIVPMNWRSSDRHPVVFRVHVGDR